MRKSKATPQASPLEANLQVGTTLRTKIKQGLTALLPIDRERIAKDSRSEFLDSLNLDDALLTTHPQEHRWDYLVSYNPRGIVIGIEVHTASTSQVSTIISKKDAAIRQLQPHSKPSARINEWIWISSGAVKIHQLDRARIRLAQNGIKLVGSELAIKHLQP